MQIKYPFLWLGQTINGVPKPWEHFDVDGVLVNAYEILTNKSATNLVKRQGIHKFLRFDGYILMDSGGYLFMKSDMVDIKPDVILELYEQSKPEFAVVLDYPLTPNMSRCVIRKRTRMTLNNTKIMVSLRKSSNPQLIPVIHGFDDKSIKWYLNRLNKIHQFSIIGIGSLVPSVFNTRGIGGIYNVIKIVRLVKEQFPDRRVHVFGVGSTLTMHLMFCAGADSVDSSSWRRKAAYGAIQLPGTGDRWVTQVRRHKTYRSLSKEDVKKLDACKCPACKKDGLPGLKTSFTLRAIHNAWVYQQEMETARKLFYSEEYENYVREILGKTHFYKLLTYIARPKI